ncbi:hypothetical protein LIA77_01768 [Sarocladium implicatum]|nr:hypothetical protein LIA77_01768 [Sarocladium implicatum]
MAFSGGTVAGVAVGCAVASFVLGAIVMTWLYRIASSDEPPPAPDPYAHEKFLRQLVEHVSDVVQPDIDHRLSWREGMWKGRHMTLHFLIGNFVSDYASGCAYDGDAPHDRPPVDSHLLHSLSGGAGEDWDKIYTNADHFERCRALKYFISRVLYLRMIPDGDCKITLLPPDMLSTYQRMLNKIPAKFMSFDGDPVEQAKSTQVLLQCWRAFTVFRCSEHRSALDVSGRDSYVSQRRPGCVRRGWIKAGTSSTDLQNELWQDDPRMPNILALESTLIEALTPFWPVRDSRGKPMQFKPFEDPEARAQLREITTLAADLALVVFSRIEPMEFFWPPSNVREGPPLQESIGSGIEIFGLRRRVPVPGCESEEHNRGPGTVIEIRPRYQDSDHIEVYLYKGGLERLKERIQKYEDIRKEQGDEETEQNKERRRRLEEELQEVKAVEPFQLKMGVETPGWDGATNFF